MAKIPYSKIETMLPALALAGKEVLEPPQASLPSGAPSAMASWKIAKQASNKQAT